MWKEVNKVWFGNKKMFEAGAGECTKIAYHEPDHCDPTHYCDIYFKDRPTQRILNIDQLEIAE